MHAFRLGLILAIVASHLLLAGSGALRAEDTTNSDSPKVPGPAAKPVPTGSLFSNQVLCEFAIYLLPDSKGKPDEALAKVLAAQKYSWVQVTEFPKSPVTKATLYSKLITDVAKSYKAPSLDSLQYFGRGISKEQAEQLQTCQQVYLVDFLYLSTDVWKASKSATELAGALGQEMNGLVWDEETREIFTPEEWAKKRVTTWTGDGAPDVTKQITIHAYKDDEFVRGITLGMSKFGLPDVVVSNFVWSEDKQVGTLIDLVAQALAEDSELTTPGEFDLDINKIKNAAMRDRVAATLLDKATSTAKLGLMLGVPEQGDPENRLVEITFDFAKGDDVHARQDAVLSSFFGWEDKVKSIKHNAELLAASQRAKDKLPALRDAFSKGFAPGEFIEVKGPFKTPDGRTEWMWVEVQSWKGEVIRGMLKNEPFFIPTLHGGQTVDVAQDDVFDYLHTFPDGHTEGNETSPIIEKMEQSGH